MATYAIPVIFLNTNPNSKATFRPGGDAQYVSYLIQGIVNAIADRNEGDEDFETYYRSLIAAEATQLGFSEPLKEKFIRAAHRVIDQELDRIARKILKEARKAARTSKVEYEDLAPVKVGRWEYPARQQINTATGEYFPQTAERNTKRDGSGEWVSLDA